MGIIDTVRLLERSTIAGNSVGVLADVVARRVVVADPDFAAGVAGYSAAYFGGRSPDDLGIVSAYFAALVGCVIVIAGFRCPGFDYLFGGRGCAIDFEQIFAVRRFGMVDELASGEQRIGPILGTCGQGFGPGQGTNR